MDTVGPEAAGFMPGHLAESLFDDRAEAGRRLASALPVDLRVPVVVGVTRGGVAIAAEVAAALHAPLDAVLVARIAHPSDPEYAIGAAAPGGAFFVRSRAGLSSAQLVVASARARREATKLDMRVHASRRPVGVEGTDVVLVDEAVTTGATMVAAVMWAREQRAHRVVAAVPVAAADGAELVREHADALACPHELEVIGARGVWFNDYTPVEDADVQALLEAAR